MAKASIITKLGLDTTAFETGLATSRKSINNFVKNGISKFGAIVGVAGFGAMTRAAVNMATEIVNLSKLSGTGVEEFQKFAYAAKTVGVEQEKLGDILKDVSDKVGDFLQTGAGTLADFFEQIAPQVGVTAEQFRELSGKDALQLYVSSLEKANLSQNEMTFYMEAIASDATLLLPLLTKNAQALTELGREASELGVIMEKETIDALVDARLEINKFQVVSTVLTGKIVSKLMPAFTLLGQGLAIVGEAFGTALGRTMNFMGFLGRSISSVVDPALKGFQSLAQGIKGVALAMTGEGDAAAAAFRKAKQLAVQSGEELKNIPTELAAHKKRMDEEMLIDEASFQKSRVARAKIAKDAMGRLLDANVSDNEDANQKKKKSNEIFQTASQMEIIKNANLNRKYLDAQISGDEKRIANAKASIEFEASIQKIQKDTNVDRKEAIKLAGQLYDATVRLEEKKLEYDKLSYQEQQKLDQSIKAREAREKERRELNKDFENQATSDQLMAEASKDSVKLEDMEASQATIQGTIFLEEIRNELTRSSGTTP